MTAEQKEKFTEIMVRTARENIARYGVFEMEATRMVVKRLMKEYSKAAALFATACL